MSKYLPLICMMATCLGASASHVTPEQALARLNKSTEINRLRQKGRVSPMTLNSTIGNIYVFTNGEGFVVLPAEDSAPALLGYSDKGTLDFAVNPELTYWLEFYNQQLQYLQTHPRQKSGNSSIQEKTRPERAEIAPLIKTEWNQEAPYNELCPKVDGHETVTGCVATAMAQAMKYFNYPTNGKGTHSYLWRPGEEELTFNYDATPFQWNLMTDVYNSESSAESRHAVAELMLGCGISVDMHYEPGESGAATTAMGSALIDIFGYSPSLWMPNRSFYGYYEWEEMIYAELSNSRPVLYSGAGTAGGHQFICDGYQGDGYFHFNWGWGGMSNGYFLLTALNPDDLGVGGGAGGFNTSQVATLGMRPAQDGDKPVYLFYNTIGFTTEVTSVKADEDFRCGGQYFNYSLSTMPKGSYLGMKFVEQGGSDGRFVEGPNVSGFHPDNGRYDLQIRFPELQDGIYIITPALKVEEKWYDVRMPVGYPSKITATIKNGIAEITNATAEEIEVTDVSFPAKTYLGHEFPLTFKVNNSGSEEYYGRVTPILTDTEGKEVATSKFRPVDVMPVSEENVTDYIALFSADKDATLTAGEYKLAFKDGSGKIVSAESVITLMDMTEDTEFTVTDFRLDQENPVSNPKNVIFSFSINCESGLFYSNVELIVFPGAGGDDVYHKNSERRYLTAGEKAEETIDADLSELKDGEYIALIYSSGKPKSDRIYFRVKRTVTGIDEISDSSIYQEVFFDLSGRRRTKPLAPGIYILREGNRSSKFVVK